MFSKLNLKKKIMIGGLLPLIFIVFVNITGLVNFNGLLKGMEKVDHTYKVIEQAMKIQTMAIDMETGQRGFLLTGNDTFLEPYKRWASNYESMMLNLEQTVSDNPKQVTQLRSAKETFNNWKTNIAEKYINKRKELDSERDKNTLNIISKIVSKQEGKAYMDAFREKMQTFIDVEQKLLKERNEHSALLTGETNQTIIWGTLAAILLAIAISIFLLKSIIQPITNLKENAMKISQGDIDIIIDVKSEDELGELANSFKIMTSYIQESSQIAHSIGEGNLTVDIKQRSENDVLGKALINMAANLRKIMSELLESTAVLNSAASEILATTTQVATGASETSSAVSQTSSSIEEIKQTASLTREKAIHTAESTKKAVQISEEGNKSLEKNMEGLAQIKDKMDSIATNIIRLSEQSQMIGNIVSTVEDIASQSNLLAVNASIEAVKAGEHGKGFSVVAQELKNLADQSKQGTREVQKILSDIQQATSTLVMVAEQGGKAVDDGVAQANSAKDSMQSLRQSVTEAAQAGTLIASSSEQEMSGMDQITGAMVNIKNSTEQNVESIKQVEESAKNLTILSQKLTLLIDQYSIDKESY